MKIPIFDHSVIKPFEQFGLTSGFWNVHIDTLMYTWLAMFLLVVVALVGRWYLKHGENMFSFALEKTIEFFSTLCLESFGCFRYDYFVFVGSLFFFVLGCNLVGLLPFIEESTRDLNTTLAVSLVSFLYVQYQKVKIEGIKLYTKEYFQPIFLLLPLNIIDKLAKIISMAFRLFGNILGGSIVFFLLIQAIAQYKTWFMAASAVVLIGYTLLSKIADERRFRHIRMIFLAGWMTLYSLAGAQMFFGIFEGVIQAFVIAMLTITYLSVTLGEQEHETTEKVE